MKIQNIKTIFGPNVFSHNPVLIMRLDLEDLAGKESYEIPGFVDRLLATLPGVQEHYCGLGRPGGFVERLRGGTYFGHIVEHVALELTDRVGISVNRGKTVETAHDGVYDVAVEFRSEAGMRCLLGIAVELVEALIADRPLDLESRLAEARRAVEENELGPSTKSIVDAASRRNIPWRRLNEESLIQLGYGIHRRLIEAAMTSRTSAIGVDIASDKHLTKALLARAEVPTPDGRIVETAEQAVRAFEELGGPLVIKPLDANQGKGVTLNVATAQEAADAFQNAMRYSRRVIVEQFYTGNDYRVLVIGGKLFAAARREPARVQGDGIRTVAQLIKEVNQDPLRSSNHGSALSHIEVDGVVHCTLKKQGLTLDSVPPEGRIVSLRENANLSTGGCAVDVTDEVHPEMRRISERAARAVGLDICGVDLIVPDIAQPYTSGGIVEVNAAPGLRMHVLPSRGEPRDVGMGIMNMLYPGGTEGRIPIISITGTNGKTTTARLTAHLMSQAGNRVGLTTTDGIWIDGEQIVSGDTTGPRSAQVVLSDDSVECAVLETARGGIVRNGLGYDWSDVGVLTNISADHVGQDGIESIDDIVKIKALVAERVRDGGTLILNADDPVVAAVRERPKVRRLNRRIVWFSMHHSSPLLNDHRTMGGTAYFPRDGWLVEAQGIAERRIVDICAVPMTLNGTAEFQIANMMAAVAAARATGAEIEAIQQGLGSFRSGDNPARMNLWRVPQGYVLFDYGHNSAAIDAVGRLVNQWGASRLTAVLTIPGDRAESIINEAAAAVARAFDRIVLREDGDLRGRAPGEIPAILRRAIEHERPDREIIEIPEEAVAARHALDTMDPGEIVVVFCETCKSLKCLLEGRECEPVELPDPAYLHALQFQHGRARIA